MKSFKVWLIVLLVGSVMFAGIIFAESEKAKDDGISIRKLKEEVVLYTVHRGGYDTTGMAIGKLFALAGQKGIIPKGSLYYVYLNNPRTVTKEHLLTEVRIPVGKEALKTAGTLGQMTDIKQLPALEVAVITKNEGQTDPGNLYQSLYLWILENRYIPGGPAREIFLSNVMSGDYGRMKTEIMVPVTKPIPGKK